MNITKWSKSCGHPNYFIKKIKIWYWIIDRLLYQFSTKKKRMVKMRYLKGTLSIFDMRFYYTYRCQSSYLPSKVLWFQWGTWINDWLELDLEHNWITLLFNGSWSRCLRRESYLVVMRMVLYSKSELKSERFFMICKKM